MAKNPVVDAWFARYDNPMKDVVLAVREAVLSADSRIEECIKWQAPTFVYKGNLASFFPKSKTHASLMFHVGRKIPGTYPRLEGTGDTSAVMKFSSLADVTSAKAQLSKLVRTWCDWRDSESAGTATADTKKSPSKTTTRSVAKKTRSKSSSKKST